MICFNCNKLGYYTTTYLKPRKVNLKELEEELYKLEEKDESRKEKL